MPSRGSARFDLNRYMAYIIFAIILAIFAVWLGGRFFSVTNLLNISRQTAMISIMAIAMTFVIASSNIDLSIGSIAALTSLIVALILQATGSILLAVVAGIALGAALGFVSGWLVSTFGVPSFLITLGMASAVKGAAMWTTNTSAVPIENEVYSNIFGLGTIGNVVPVLLIWTIVAACVGYFALNSMAFGKWVLATGGNVVAARYTGVKVKAVTIAVMVLSGISASLAGMLYAGRMQTARYTIGEGDELNVIAAVVLGGTSMAGGTGSIVGAIVGSLLMGMISNGLIIGGFSVSQQMIIRGLIIVLAVVLGSLGNRRKMDRA
jgi:ribose/xylose/arabinose/galactoside ABC-type transport system permease subunit